jgi:superfamily II DNA/RNA helicase
MPSGDDEHTVKMLKGDLNQKQRHDSISRFRNNQCKIMIATDIAARGIDVDNVTSVINFDVAGDADTHCHRIGRTGRAGRKGTAYTFLQAENSKYKDVLWGVPIVRRSMRLNGQTERADQLQQEARPYMLDANGKIEGVLRSLVRHGAVSIAFYSMKTSFSKILLLS